MSEAINLDNRAPESLRRANSRAKERSQQWKKNYSVVTQLIRESRGESIRRVVGPAKADMRLRALRQMAVLMMIEREQIKQELRDTAYEWV